MDIIIFFISLFGLLNKRRLYLAITGQIVLATGYLGLHYYLRDLSFIKESNLILALVIFILFFVKFKFKKQFNYNRELTNAILLFYLFLLISVLFDILVNGVPIYDILSSIKLWIFLSALWIYPCISLKHIFITFKILLYLTVSISILILIDYAFGQSILSEIKINSEGLRRSMIPSTFTLFYIFSLQANLIVIRRKLKILFSVVLILTVVLSVIRSLILAMVIGQLLILYYKRKTFIFKNIKIIVLALVILTIASLNKDINRRFSNMFEEVTAVAGNNKVDEGTTFLRYKLLEERFNYVVKNPQTFLLGLGNLREENVPIIFKYGNSSRKDGLPDQLYTPDISWSNLIIRLGIVGSLIYLIIYLRLLRTTYKKRNIDMWYRVLFIYLFVTFFIVSFASSIISVGSFWLLAILVYSYANKLRKISIIQNLERSFN